MEKKTNKAKLEIFKNLRKSDESQGFLIKLAEIVLSMGSQFIYTYLIFLYGISTMKTVKNNTVFMKTQK